MTEDDNQKLNETLDEIRLALARSAVHNFSVSRTMLSPDTFKVSLAIEWFQPRILPVQPIGIEKK